ncbi:MAG: HDOD domain-containing protein [Vicinamibacterales bacterium]
MPDPQPQSSSASEEVFLARQPILDDAQRVVAYELLFRPTLLADAAGTASAQATARVISDAVLAFGLDTLTLGRPAFINVTRDLLLSGIPEALPPGHVVVELLEDIEGDAEVIDAVQRLRRSGYKVALDDFVLSDRTAPLVRLANYVKVEVGAGVTLETRDRVRDINPAVALLAEKVETREQFEASRAAGFQYFQGFFFGRPVTQAARGIPANRVGYVQLLCALQDPDLTVDRLERLVKHDAVLCYRILRTVNSAAFAQARRIESIRQAILLIGRDALRRWASIWVLAGLADGAQAELVVMSTVRARCCELLASSLRRAPSVADAFLLGMLSLIDVILERPIELLVQELPLPDRTRDALLGRDTECRRLLDCTIAYERGDWTRCLDLAARAAIDPHLLPVAHQEALRWAADFQRAA